VIGVLILVTSIIVLVQPSIIEAPENLGGTE
jgi:hypothetical protein